MQVTVNKKEVGVYELNVDVNKEVWAKAQSKAFDKLSKDVQIAGFRKGKAPAHLLKEKVDPSKALNEAVSSLLNETFQAALAEAKLVPVMQPSYDVSKVSDSELSLVFRVVSAPEITLGSYKDLKVGHQEVEVTDAQIEAKLLEYQNRGAELILKEEPASLGDTVVIDFEGFVDGVAFDGGKAENHELELGSGSFIPGFEDQIVGKKAGEDFDVNITFPENYTAALKGKPAVFKVKVHEVKTKNIPALSDELAQGLGLENVTDLASLRVHVLSELTKEAERNEKNRYIDALIDQIRASSTFEIAEDFIHEEGHHRQHKFVDDIKAQGFEWAQYLEMTGQTEEEIHDRFHEEARLNIQNFLVLSKVGELEKIEVTDADVDFEVAKMAQTYKMEEKKIREILGKNLTNMKNDIRQQRVIDFLLENNK